MVGDNREVNPMSFLRDALSSQQRRKKKIGAEVIQFLKRGKLPTPDDIREAINFCVGIGEEREEILRYHPYWKERQLRLGLESLIRAAHQAYVDICRHDAALGSLAKARDFEDHVDQTIGDTAQKDVFAYCSLAVGVRDTLRRIEKVRLDIKDEIRDVSCKYFSHNVTAFINKMKNDMIHGSVMIPKWQISYDFQSSSGSMTYSEKELLSFGDWNKESKEYIRKANDGKIDISKVVGEHFKLLRDFEREIQDLFARNITDAERDFFEIEDSYKKIQRRQWTKILISQIGKGKDPYEYLHRFFEPETVREILRRPRHSKEQVDFIVALKAAELDCDDDLRCLLYKKFGVVDDSST